MEKLIYMLWCDPGKDVVELGDRLRLQLAPKLLELGASGVQVNVSDEEVRRAAPAINKHIDAFVLVWVPAGAVTHQVFTDAVGQEADRYAGYLVNERLPMLNTRYPVEPGQRTHGFAQIASIPKPPQQDRQEWLDIWLGSHTQIAIDTQDTFEYVQNVVVKAVTDNAPVYDAIVEEGFPMEAFDNSQGFYDAIGDQEKFLRHQDIMMKSCARFIDLGTIDVVQTSQYVIKSPR